MKTTATALIPFTALRQGTPILPTENESWGFWGTALRNLEGEGRNLIHHDGTERDASEVRKELWDAVSGLLQDTFLLTPAQARDFLDSTAGRHLADDLIGCQAFEFYSHEIDGSSINLGKIAGIPSWIKRSIRDWAKVNGLHVSAKALR